MKLDVVGPRGPPRRHCLVGLADTPQRLALLVVQVRFALAMISILLGVNRQRVVEQTQGPVERPRLHRLLPGQRQKPYGLVWIGRHTGLIQMLRDIGRVSVDPVTVDLFHRVGHPQVPALAAHQRHAAFQGLTNQPVCEIPSVGLDPAPR